MAFSDYLKLDESSIKQKVEGLRKEIFELQLEKSTTGLEKPHLRKNKKKEIAQLLTALRAKEAEGK